MPFDTAKLAATLPWDQDWVTAVTFVGSSRTLIAGNRLGGLLRYDLPAELDAKQPPMPTRALEGHSNGITHLASTPDGKLIVSASFDHTIALWNIDAPPTGKKTVVLEGESAKKQAKAAGKEKQQPARVELDLIKPAKVLTEHTEWIQAMAISRDGEMLVTGDDAGEIIVWSLPAGTVLKRWKTKGWISALAVTPDKKQVVAAERIPLDGDRFRALSLWDVATGAKKADLLPAISKKEIEFASADISPDGKTLAVGQGDDETESSKVFFLDLADPKKGRESKSAHQYGVRCVRFTADSKHAISGGRDTMIRVWNPADGSLVKEIGTPRGGQFKDWICDLAISQDAKLIAAADMAGAVQIWDCEAKAG